jgi:hypothetical protein
MNPDLAQDPNRQALNVDPDPDLDPLKLGRSDWIRSAPPFSGDKISCLGSLFVLSVISALPSFIAAFLVINLLLLLLM